MILFAHSGHTETTAPTSADTNLLDTIAHQSPLIALAFSLVVIAGWFGLMGLFRLRLLDRLLAMLPVIIGLAILFFTHNPVVASLLLTAGFVAAFVIAFVLLKTRR